MVIFFYSPGGSWCKNLWLCRVMGKHASNCRRHVITLTFDLSTSKWGHGSPVGFPPANFQLAMPFRSGLRVRHGTNRRTDRQRSSLHNAPTLWERKHNSSTSTTAHTNVLLDKMFLSLYGQASRVKYGTGVGQSQCKTFFRMTQCSFVEPWNGTT